MDDRRFVISSTDGRISGGGQFAVFWFKCSPQPHEADLDQHGGWEWAHERCHATRMTDVVAVAFALQLADMTSDEIRVVDLVDDAEAPMVAE